MIAICHPDDSAYAARFHIKERIVTTDHCPRQMAVVLGDRLALMAESGAWFSEAPDAQIFREALARQHEFEEMLETGYLRCRATTVAGTQCRNAVHKKHGTYCKKHHNERLFNVLRIGEGLDQENDNPLTSKNIDELVNISNNMQFVLSCLRQHVQAISQVENQPDHLIMRAIERVEKDHERLLDITDMERREDQKQRMTLRIRIQRMVERIERTYHREGKAIHSEWIDQGGSPQADSSIEDLKAKCDWLYLTYTDAFPADTREWLPPGLSGSEPGLVRKVKS